MATSAIAKNQNTAVMAAECVQSYMKLYQLLLLIIAVFVLKSCNQFLIYFRKKQDGGRIKKSVVTTAEFH